MKRLWLVAGSFLILLFHSEADAATCSVVATPVLFGVYVPTAISPVDSNGAITVSCKGTGNVSYTIALSAGLNGAGYLPRRMLNSAASFLLDYNLYIDAGRTVIWGNGSPSTLIVTDSYRIPGPEDVIRTYPVYGRLFPLQAVGVGEYTDVITVTVDY